MTSATNKTIELQTYKYPNFCISIYEYVYKKILTSRPPFTHKELK